MRCAAAESQFRVAVRFGANLLDAIELDDGGSVDAGEARRIELRFERGERVADEVLAGRGRAGGRSLSAASIQSTAARSTNTVALPVRTGSRVT
jgi:hypothetical protein